jgi:putative transposase
MRRVLRLMREHDLLAPGRFGSPRGPHTHDGTIIPETIDVMWGTDLTTTFTGEGPAAVFIAVDHCSAECVGIHAHARATRFEALEPIRQGCAAIPLAGSPGTSPEVSRCGTITARDTCRITSRKNSRSWASKARPLSSARQKATAAPNGSSAHGKENLLWVQHFETIEDLHQALPAFRKTYNTTWLSERHGYLTPTRFREKQLQPLADLA